LLNAAGFGVQMRRAFVCLALLACGLTLGVSTVSAAPADLDRSFGGGDGIAEVPASGDPLPGEAGARMVIGPHDEIFVLYSNYPPCDPPFGCHVELSVARYTPDGQLDPAFGPGPQLTVKQSPLEDEFDLAVGPDGKPVVAAYGGEAGLVVARLGLDGRLDPSFGSGGVASAPEKLIANTRGMPKVAVQSDGKVLVAVQGGFEGEGQEQAISIVRFTAAGQLDSEFGAGGEARPLLPTQTKPTEMFVGVNGAITIPAPYCCLGGTPLYGEGFSVARLQPNGQFDPSWAGDGSLFFPTPGAQGSVEAATPTPDGGLFLSYEASTPTVSTVGNLIKLTPSGALDPSFGKGGGLRVFNRVGTVDPSDLALDAKGRLVGVGWGGGRISVFRLLPNGSKDRTFNGGERIVVPYGGGGETNYTVGIQSTGRIIAFGNSGIGASKRFGLIALRGGTDRSRCLGKKATIVGTQGRDRLIGTPHRDVIAALGGADEVRGLGGPDLICGGKGRDRLFGGAGKDQVRL
jgi:serralysin